MTRVKSLITVECINKQFFRLILTVLYQIICCFSQLFNPIVLNDSQWGLANSVDPYQMTQNGVNHPFYCKMKWKNSLGIKRLKMNLISGHFFFLGRRPKSLSLWFCGAYANMFCWKCTLSRAMIDIGDIYSFAVNTTNIVIEWNENISIFTSAKHKWKFECFHYTRWKFYGIHWKRVNFLFVLLFTRQCTFLMS